MFCHPKTIFTVLAFSASVLFAAGNGIWDYPLKKENAKDIDKAFAEMTSHAVIRGNFKQTKSIPQLNKEFVSNGTFVIANGNGILWNTETPFASKLSISDTKMVQVNANGNRSEIKAEENIVFAQISKTIQSVFSGNTKKLEEEFKVYFKKQDDNWEIGLIPKEAAVQKAIASIELSGGTWLTTVKLIDGSKSPLLYELSNPKPADKLTAEEQAFFAK